MTKTLHLIRHAKTEKISQDNTDISRKLTEKGIVQANVLAEALFQKNFQTDETLVSTAIRTRETAKILSNRLNLGQVTYFSQLYLATLNELIQLISSNKDSDSITIIGHNEGLTEVVNYFTGEEIYLKPSDHVKILFYVDNWSEISRQAGQLNDQNCPSVLLL